LTLTRLLAICPIGIGNFLLLVPALEHLKQQRPDVGLTLLSLKSGISALAGRFAFIDGIITVDADQKQSLGSKLALLRQLFRKFDVSISFFPSNRLEYNLLPFIACIPRRLAYGYHTGACRTLSWLNTDHVPVSEEKHDLMQNFSALEKLGISPPEVVTMPGLPLMDQERAKASEFLRGSSFEGRPLIGLHPGSSAEHHMDRKRWPVERFADLARQIRKDRDARFLVFGGPEEKALKNELQALIGPEARVVENGSFFETAAIIALCSRFISNDSGLMHVATAVGVRTCGIFGPTDDKRTAPFGQGHLVIRGPEDCSPCWTIRNVGKREECLHRDFRCLQGLSAEYVYERIRAWI
jgi:heptosyltransferase II